MMDSELYRKWLEDIDALSPAQRAEVRSLLAGRSSEAEVIAALERRVWPLVATAPQSAPS